MEEDEKNLPRRRRDAETRRRERERWEEHVEKHGRAFLLKMIGKKKEVSSQAFMWGKTSRRF